MIRPVVRLSLLLAAFVCCIACGQSQLCTLVDCWDDLTITIVQDELEPTEVGSYDVLFHPQGGDTIELVCEITAEEGGSCHEPGEVDGGTASGPSGHASINGQLTVTIHQNPSQFTVEVRSEQTLLGEEDFEPEYDKHRPNGPDCPPVCYSADLQMLVDSPPQEE